MAIGYLRLWKLLIDLNLKKTDLRAKGQIVILRIIEIEQGEKVRKEYIPKLGKPKAHYTLASLFSGCGGLDLGEAFIFFEKIINVNP